MGMIYNINDKVITKKLHPCGCNSWTIIRTGADIKIKCDNCGRIVMIGLDKFPKAVKIHIPYQGDKNE